MKNKQKMRIKLKIKENNEFAKGVEEYKLQKNNTTIQQ